MFKIRFGCVKFRRIFVEGEVGVGKSIFLYKIVYDWFMCNNEFLYKIVIFVELK